AYAATAQGGRRGGDGDLQAPFGGRVFNAVNQDVYEARDNPNPRKADYYFKDLQLWAAHCGVTIVMPPPIFPVRAVDPMRAVIAAAEKGKLEALSLALFKAYWSDLEDISQHEVIARLGQQVGLDPDWLLDRMKAPDVKAQLKANTEELIERGGFGSPTFFVGDAMFFGNDRLPLVKAALTGTLGAAAA
ncbi:MAG: DsbA family protein, partial [Pseudomonadota bacterium]